MPWESQWDASDWFGSNWFGSGASDPNAMRAHLTGTSSLTADLTGGSSATEGDMQASLSGECSVLANLSRRRRGWVKKYTFPQTVSNESDDDELILAACMSFIECEDKWEALLTV